MVHAHGFTVRRAQDSDEPTLSWLTSLSSEPALRRPILIGHLDGMPAAALSLVDGRLVENPLYPAPGLAGHLRLHRAGWRLGARREALRTQLRRILPFLV
jgi:hypothetical protein